MKTVMAALAVIALPMCASAQTQKEAEADLQAQIDAMLAPFQDLSDEPYFSFTREALSEGGWEKQMSPTGR